MIILLFIDTKHLPNQSVCVGGGGGRNVVHAFHSHQTSPLPNQSVGARWGCWGGGGGGVRR